MTNEQYEEIKKKLQNIIESNPEMKEFTEKANDLMERKRQGNMTDNEFQAGIIELTSIDTISTDIKWALLLMMLMFKENKS